MVHKAALLLPIYVQYIVSRKFLNDPVLFLDGGLRAQSVFQVAV